LNRAAQKQNGRPGDEHRDARKSKQPDSGLPAGQLTYGFPHPLRVRLSTFGILFLLASVFFAAFFFAILLFSLGALLEASRYACRPAA
jgi:hypothetical protein